MAPYRQTTHTRYGKVQRIARLGGRTMSGTHRLERITRRIYKQSPQWLPYLQSAGQNPTYVKRRQRESVQEQQDNSLITGRTLQKFKYYSHASCSWQVNDGKTTDQRWASWHRSEKGEDWVTQTSMRISYTDADRNYKLQQTKLITSNILNFNYNH